MALTDITVTGLYRLVNDTPPPRGSKVTFALNATLTDTATGETVGPLDVPVYLDTDGAFSTLLTATTDPTTDPPDARYEVTEDIGGETRSYFVAIPHDAGPQVLGLLAEADVAPPVTYGLSSIVATSPLSATRVGGVVTLSIDGSGYTTDAELATEASTRATGDSTNAAAIVTEAGTARAAESANAAAILAEAVTARAAEDGLFNDLDATTGALNGAIATQAAHSAETTTAHGGIVSSADARLSDARAPTAHSASHGSAGGDAVTPAAIGASATAHTHTHAAATGQTANDHHAQAHGHTGADSSGTVAHSALTGTGVDDHHAKSHTHNADGSGTVPYSALSSPPTIPTLAGLLRPLKVGDWLVGAGGATTLTGSDGVLTYTPLPALTQPQTVNQLACEVVTTPGTTGSVVRLGLYATGADGHPGALVSGTEGTVDTTATGIKTLTLSPAVVLPAGQYWAGAVRQGTPATPPTLRVYSVWLPAVYAGDATTALSSTVNAYIQTSVTGALPSPAVPSGTTSGGIRVSVRISA